jgi:hypothetical protein
MPPDRYFVSIYTDGPSTCWNVIDRRTQEWVRRFPTEQEAKDYASAITRASDAMEKASAFALGASALSRPQHSTTQENS